MNEFNTKVMKIFFIILGISLFLFAIAMDKALKSELFPKHKLICPDYWTYKKVSANDQLAKDISNVCTPLIDYDLSEPGVGTVSQRTLNATNYPEIPECYPGAGNNSSLYKKPLVYLDISFNNESNPGNFLKYKNTSNEEQEKLCINYKWTQSCGVVWDGVSNAKNPCTFK